MPEFRCYGPPGTGKTTWLARQLQRAAEKYSPERIYACSFTRAAAVELAGRDVPVPEENLGTIHSLCYHRLGRPPILEVETELWREWTERNPTFAALRPKVDLDEPPEEFDELMEWNRERATLGRHRCLQRHFVEAWEAFKREREVFDFTDLLLRAPQDLGADVLFVDEAQDLTPLQWQVVRRWGANAEVFVVVGDDDQLIYEFLGASPREFLSPLPQDRKLYLRQTHRLPRAVWQRAEAWIARCRQREPKRYEPRDAEGCVRVVDYRFGSPEQLVQEAAGRAEAGQTVMLLASCGYMLRPVIEVLRVEGVPFHNPYRRKRGDWNPLRSTARRLLAFGECSAALREGRVLHAAGTWAEWLKLVSASALQRGAKAAVQRFAAEKRPVVEDDLAEWLTVPALDALERGDAAWLCEHAVGGRRAALEYPTAVWRRGGFDALRRRPRVVVGTIHSTKGGEADIVYLSPDLSWQAVRALDESAEARDALVRQFYVGMTRAREELVLCAPSGPHFVNW